MSGVEMAEMQGPPKGRLYYLVENWLKKLFFVGGLVGLGLLELEVFFGWFFWGSGGLVVSVGGERKGRYAMVRGGRKDERKWRKRWLFGDFRGGGFRGMYYWDVKGTFMTFVNGCKWTYIVEQIVLENHQGQVNTKYRLY